MSPNNLAQLRSDATEFDSVNLSVVPIILVPGVMGTRLQLAGPDWDPDTATEMLKLVFLRQRNLANLLDARKPAVVFTTFGSTAIAQINSDPTLVSRAETLTGQSANGPAGGSGGGGGGASGPGSGGASSNTGNVPANPVASNFYAANRGWAGVTWDFYGDLLMKLEARFLDLGNFPVYAVGYDWRQSCRISGAALVQSIQSICKKEQAKKVLIVTHSMGGLVLRSALQQGAMSLVQGVVHCVMPAHGAVVAYRRFHTGATDVLDGHNPTAAPSFFPTVAGIVLDRILGLTPIEYAVTQANLPGPLELLPTNEYPGIFIRFPSSAQASLVLEANTAGTNSLVTPPQVDIYSVYLQTQQPGIVPNDGDSDGFSLIPVDVPAGLTGAALGIPFPVPVPGDTIAAADVASLNQNIANARVFHASIRDLVHPNTSFLFGDIINTDSLVDFTKVGGAAAGTQLQPPSPGAPGTGGAGSVDPNDPTSTGGSGPGPSAPAGLAKNNVTVQMAIKKPAGDGTVPSLSARFTSASGSRIFRRTFPVQHSECFKEPTFREEVKQQLLKFAGLPPDKPGRGDI